MFVSVCVGTCWWDGRVRRVTKWINHWGKEQMADDGGYGGGGATLRFVCVAFAHRDEGADGGARRNDGAIGVDRACKVSHLLGHGANPVCRVVPVGCGANPCEVLSLDRRRKNDSGHQGGGDGGERGHGDGRLDQRKHKG